MKKVSTTVEVIRITHPFNQFENHQHPKVMALGFFDGLHLGHQKVIQTAIQKAKQLQIKSAVMTFDPHPRVVLGLSDKPMKCITPLEEKIRLMEELGVDYLYIVNFDRSFASLLPEDFIEQYIISFNVKHVVAGFDYTYGKFGKGNMETMIVHAKGRFEVTVVEKLTSAGVKVSSSHIRHLLEEGHTDEVPQFLGRHYVTKGTVIHGDKRGRTIGFPTANIQMEEDYFLPKKGVYSVRIKVKNQWHFGVCNIGYKPTFHSDNFVLSVEVYILDFNDEIYNEPVVVEWHGRIRDEKKFSGIDELKAQLTRDAREASQYFSKLTAPLSD